MLRPATLLTALLLGGCAPKTQWMTPTAVLATDPACAPGTPGTTRHDSAGIRITEHRTDPAMPAIALASAISIRGSASATAHPFGIIADAAQFASGNIVVADSQTSEVFLFDSTGAFLRQIGRRGEGPGEYQKIRRVVRLADDTIAIMDQVSRRITLLRPDGSTAAIRRPTTTMESALSKSVTESGNLGLVKGDMIVAGEIQILGSATGGGYLAVQRQNWVFQGKHKADHVMVLPGNDWILRLDQEGVQTAELGEYTMGWSSAYEYPGNNGISPSKVLFAPLGSIAVAPGGYWLARGARHEIERHAFDGALTGLVRVCRDSVPVTAALLKEARARAVAESRSNEDLVWILPKTPVWPVQPAWQEIVAGAGGQLWARDFSLRNEAAIWWVFGADGAVLGVVTLPADRRLIDVAYGKALMIATDSLGVRSLEVARLPGALQ